MSYKIFAWIGITIFFYYLVYGLFVGISHPIPALGDSWDYHIPISQMILKGDFIMPHNVLLPQWYYPGSSEAINSILLLFHVPLTLSNMLPVIILFFLCWKLGGIYKLNFYESIFFAATIVTLNVFVRWYNSVSIDVWLINFFLSAIIFFERPRDSDWYFFLLGLIFGMIVGTKYTGFYYVISLVLLYSKSIVPLISIKRLFYFIIPFIVFGISWYIRNLILFNNPFYPMYFFGLPYAINFSTHVWNIGITYPRQMFNAFFGEYKIWSLLIPVSILVWLTGAEGRRLSPLIPFSRLLILGLVGFFVLLLSPSDNKEWIMVSSFRYSYPCFVLLILAVFLIFKNLGKIEILSLVSVASMIMVTSFNYYPKLALIYTPFTLITIYLIERYKKQLLKLTK